MILVVDCGNTYSNFGLFATYDKYKKFNLPSESLLDNVLFSKINELVSKDVVVSKAIISSVVPSKNSLLSSVFKSLGIEAVFLEEITDILDINFQIDNINELGADRVANCFYACEKMQNPAIIIDFGTATTFDFISAKREYLGGVIMPGLQLAVSSLAEKTENLKEILFNPKDSLIGKNTEDAINSGILYGNLGAIEYMVNKSRKIFDEDVQIYATGGFGRIIAARTNFIEKYDPDLTLKALYLIAKKTN